jgi:DNA invertase Pin-like site-specific DNA recombinase
LHYALQKRSVRCMTELTVRQAREMLTAWAAEQDAVAARRDEVVRAAVDAGVSKSEVHRLTGIARTTVDRIVGSGHEQPAERGTE